MDIIDNLISAYPLDVDVNDAHASNDGTGTDISYEAGKISNAARFNGSTSKVVFDGNPFTASQGAFSCWFNSDVATNSVYQGLVGYGGGNEPANPRLFSVAIDGNGSNLRFGVLCRTTGDVQIDVLYTGYDFSPSTWYHIVLNSDGAEWTLYVNNVEQTLNISAGVNSGNWFGDVEVYETDQTVIGARLYDGTTEYFFDGLIDQVMFFDDVLTSSQISTLYNAGAGLAYSVFLTFASVSESLEITDTLSSQLEGDSGLSESIVMLDSLFLSWDEDISDAVGFADLPIAVWIQEIAESLIVGDATTLAWVISLSESIFAWDIVQSQWEMQLSESLGVTDSVTPELILIISEYFQFIDGLYSHQNGTITISDAISIHDSNVSWLGVIYETISEVLELTDTPTLILILLVTDYMNVREVLSNNLECTNSVSETITLTDAVVAQWLMGLAESLVLVDSVTDIRTILESLADGVTFSDVLSKIGVFNVTITDTMKFSDSVQEIVRLLISEGLVLTDMLTSLRDIYLSISESLGLTDALTSALNIYLSLSENIVLVDSPSNTGTLYSTIQEGIALNVTIEIDNEVYECWVLNTPSFYPSIYTGFDFNSYCEFGGRAFGANSVGIYELTGDDDAGTEINTGVLLKNTDFEIQNKKRFRRGYIGVSGDAPVMVMESDSGEQKVYSISDSGKVSALREIVGKEWVLSIADFDQLDSIELIPVILAKGR